MGTAFLLNTYCTFEYTKASQREGQSWEWKQVDHARILASGLCCPLTFPASEERATSKDLPVLHATPESPHFLPRPHSNPCQSLSTHLPSGLISRKAALATYDPPTPVTFLSSPLPCAASHRHRSTRWSTLQPHHLSPFPNLLPVCPSTPQLRSLQWSSHQHLA